MSKRGRPTPKALRKAPARQPQEPRQPTATPLRDAGGGLQYTVRNVPRAVDALLRRRAAEAGLSFNELLRRVLIKEAGLGGGEARLYNDLDHLAGKWVEDPEFDAALAAQDIVDESLWK